MSHFYSNFQNDHGIILSVMNIYHFHIFSYNVLNLENNHIHGLCWCYTPIYLSNVNRGLQTLHYNFRDSGSQLSLGYHISEGPKRVQNEMTLCMLKLSLSSTAKLSTLLDTIILLYWVSKWLIYHHRTSQCSEKIYDQALGMG